MFVSRIVGSFDAALFEPKKKKIHSERSVSNYSIITHRQIPNIYKKGVLEKKNQRRRKVPLHLNLSLQLISTFRSHFHSSFGSLILNNTHHFQNPTHLRSAAPNRRLLDPEQPHLRILPYADTCQTCDVDISPEKGREPDR